MIHFGIGKQINFHSYKHLRALKECSLLMNTSIEKCRLHLVSPKRDFFTLSLVGCFLFVLTEVGKHSHCAAWCGTASAQETGL